MGNIDLRFGVLIDNGMFEIYLGADGKLHIRRIIPDPPPDILSELQAVSVILNEAARLRNRGLAEKAQHLAEAVLNSKAETFAGYLGQAQQAREA